MKITYQLICKVDMSFLPSVDRILSEVNKHMASFNFDEKIMLLSEAPVLSITANREFTDAEKLVIMQETQKHFDESPILKKFTVVEMKKIL